MKKLNLKLFKDEILFDAEQGIRLPLRLALLGLDAVCNEDGQFVLSARRLKLDIFPYDEDVDMSKILDELLRLEFVIHAHDDVYILSYDVWGED